MKRSFLSAPFNSLTGEEALTTLKQRSSAAVHLERLSVSVNWSFSFCRRSFLSVASTGGHNLHDLVLFQIRIGQPHEQTNKQSNMKRRNQKTTSSSRCIELITIDSDSDMEETPTNSVALNTDAYYHILAHLNSTDATNFLEVVSENSQFQSIAASSDQIFCHLVRQTGGSERIPIPRQKYDRYLVECEVKDDKLVPVEERHSNRLQPLQRLSVYRCFSIEGFAKLSKTYRTPLFQCYSRLLPFNGNLYNADFGLVDYELYYGTMCSERALNMYERSLFKRK